MAVTYVNQIGATDGMNQAAPSALIPDSSVVWSQDVLFDRAGIMRRRGPFNSIATYKSVSGTKQAYPIFNNNASLVEERVLACAFTYTPNGDERIGIIVNVRKSSDTYSIIRVFDGNFTYLGSEVIIASPNNKIAVLPEFYNVNVRPASHGGVWFVFSSSNTEPTNQFQFYWHGGAGYIPATVNTIYDDTLCLPTEFVGDIDVETLPGRYTAAGYTSEGVAYSTTIGGIADTSKLSAGQFIYSKGNDGNLSAIFIGVISSVNTNSITLENRPNIFNTNIRNNKAYNASTNTGGLAAIVDATFIATTVRPYEHLHGRGLITTDHANTTFKSGTIGGLAEGHWQSAGISSSWNIYRSSDNAFLGRVSENNGIIDNANGNFSASPNIDLAADEYVMQNLTDYTEKYYNRYTVNTGSLTTFAGLYTTTYQGLQWWGGFSKVPTRASRVTFSASNNGEAVDLSVDAADSIEFPGNSQLRGIASTVAGLVVFLDNKTYIIRGSNRSNFTVEQLYPEGCLSASSIVEYGGGVFWAGTSGFFYFDGSSVRNIVQESMGQYYADGISRFDPEKDVIYAWFYRNYIFITFSNFNSPYIPYRYEAVYQTEWDDNVTEPQLNRTWQDLIAGDAVGVNGFGFDYNNFEGPNPSPFYWDRKPLIGQDLGEAGSQTTTWNSGANWETNYSTYVWGGEYNDVKNAITFAVYMPTLALTTIKNMQVNAATTYETVFGSRGVIAVNNTNTNSSSVKTRMAIVEPKSMLDFETNGQDSYTCSLNNVSTNLIEAGPDLFLQTKCFTVGDPILRKWFQRLLINMVLQDGAIRVDFLDSDNNDEIDVSVKKPKTWQVFTPNGYNWRYLTTKVFKSLTSSTTPNWRNIENANLTWVELALSDYERYTKRFSWRKSGLGLRIYQLNNYRTNSQVTTPDKPERVDIQGFTIGFKPLRSGRQ